MNIGVAGITGRMGRLVAEEISAAGACLFGGLSARGASSDARPGFGVDELAQGSATIIDFTHSETAVDHARALSRSGCAWVLGTTGLSPADQAAVVDAARQIAVVQSANFAPGITLLLDLVRRMAGALPEAGYDAEILEMHHRQKRDAPSGTALALGRAVAEGRGTGFVPLADRAGGQGGRPVGVGFASLRGGQVVGDHTVLFAGDTEHISIRHEALDRRIFARGAVRAALWTRGRAPGLYGMEDVLGLTAPTEESTPHR